MFPLFWSASAQAVGDNIRKRGGTIAKIFDNANAAWLRLDAKAPHPWDFFWLGLAGLLIFPSIRKRMGPNLRALICGSAPLARETQLFFMMLGIRVLQVYGLTETTAICTMDDPQRVEPGRVGPAIPGIEMKIAEGGEIIVRGPNIFPGYWRRPEQSATVLREGWFHTGDQGDVDAQGNWRITGRIKNLIILNSGHNIAPEPIEEELFRAIPGIAARDARGQWPQFSCRDNYGHGCLRRGSMRSLSGLMPHCRTTARFAGITFRRNCLPLKTDC